MLNIERWPRRMARMLVARVQAMTKGMKEHGRTSKSRKSMAGFTRGGGGLKGAPGPGGVGGESGFRIATLASVGLRVVNTASMASGMPWPLIFSEPYLAMKPIISAPTTGVTMIHGPIWVCWGLQKEKTTPG